MHTVVLRQSMRSRQPGDALLLNTWELIMQVLASMGIRVRRVRTRLTLKWVPPRLVRQCPHHCSRLLGSALWLHAQELRFQCPLTLTALLHTSVDFYPERQCIRQCGRWEVKNIFNCNPAVSGSRLCQLSRASDQVARRDGSRIRRTALLWESQSTAARYLLSPKDRALFRRGTYMLQLSWKHTILDGPSLDSHRRV